MAHREQFRKGWRGEYLAAYLLSRIAFIAQPISIGEDVGIDFICTLYERRIPEDKRSQEFYPQTSFAVQIKTGRIGSISMSMRDKIEYFNTMGLPYFLGHLEEDQGSLSIYSGEILPIFFSMHGIDGIGALTLKPVNEMPKWGEYWEKRKKGRFHLKLPRVLTCRVDDSEDAQKNHFRKLHEVCELVRYNISAKNNNEHIYKVRSPELVVNVYGPGSAKHFRANFSLRLAEVFSNLTWIGENVKKDFNQSELEAFASAYIKVKRFLPKDYGLGIVEKTYQKAAEFLEKLKANKVGER